MILNGVMALFCVISANSGSFRAHCVKFTFAISSLDEFLYYSAFGAGGTAICGKRFIITNSAYLPVVA